MKESITNDRSSKYYRFGKEYFGPFLYGFTRWLYTNVCRDNCRKVFFFSRDGYMMERAFDIINERHIETEYVYFSRKSIRQALLYRTTNYEDSLKYLSPERYYSVAKILEYYGFDEEERKRLAYNEGVDLETELAHEQLYDSKVIQDLYQKLRETIATKSMEQDRLLLKYIKQVGMKDNCGIVDIGWHGSMQYYLEEFFKIHNLEVRMSGYYVGILPRVTVQGEYRGYVYNPEKPDMRKKLLCFFGGLEKLFQSKEGSTYGYSETEEGVVIPILNKYEYAGEEHKEVLEAIEAWQMGALAYVEKAISEHLDLPDKVLIEPLLRFGRKPALKEVKLLDFLYNNDGSIAYYINQKHIWEYTPREFIHAFSDSPWKTGFMRSAFKLPLPYYWIYDIMKK